ncbi:hypothetical protein JHK85_010125 [Glycine max]|nr:hypothetical protein JHK85_010125 [Glycine max]
MNDKELEELEKDDGKVGLLGVGKEKANKSYFVFLADAYLPSNHIVYSVLATANSPNTRLRIHLASLTCHLCESSGVLKCFTKKCPSYIGQRARLIDWLLLTFKQLNNSSCLSALKQLMYKYF